MSLSALLSSKQWLEYVDGLSLSVRPSRAWVQSQYGRRELEDCMASEDAHLEVASIILLSSHWSWYPCNWIGDWKISRNPQYLNEQFLLQTFSSFLYSHCVFCNIKTGWFPVLSISLMSLWKFFHPLNPVIYESEVEYNLCVFSRPIHMTGTYGGAGK